MDHELKQLLTLYAMEEQDNPTPTLEDLVRSMKAGLEQFGDEQGLKQALRRHFGIATPLLQ